MRNNNVVFIFRDIGTGGSQKIEAFVANLAVEKGFDVIAINMSNTPASVILDSNIKIKNCLYDGVEKQTGRIKKLLCKSRYLFQMRKAILEENPRFVVSFLSDVVRITSLSLTGTSIPIIGSERGDPEQFTQKQFQRYKKAYKKCAAVVFQLENVKKKYNLSPDIYQEVIPNPCTPRTLNGFSHSKNRIPVIMSAGRMVQQKRFDVLIKAFSIVNKKHPEYTLKLFGDGPLRKDLEQLSIALDAGRVEFIGDVKDVFEIAKDSEMFVLSSDYEGIPNVLMEAMASKIPCISTDCSPGGASFLLKGGELGLIVECGNEVKLAEALNQYIENPLQRHEMAERAFASLADYNPEIIKNRWGSIFKYVEKI